MTFNFDKARKMLKKNTYLNQLIRQTPTRTISWVCCQNISESIWILSKYINCGSSIIILCVLCIGIFIVWKSLGTLIGYVSFGFIRFFFLFDEEEEGNENYYTSTKVSLETFE